MSNSVISNSPLSRRELDCPWICPCFFSHLLWAISNSVISNCFSLSLAQIDPAYLELYYVPKKHWSTSVRKCSEGTTGSPYKSCGPICLNKACSNPSLCYLLSDERSVAHSAIFDNPPHPSRRGGGGGGGGGIGQDCQIWRNEQPIARPTRDNTNLGLNKLYSNKSVHNSCMGSLWRHLTRCTESWHVYWRVHGNESKVKLWLDLPLVNFRDQTITPEIWRQPRYHKLGFEQALFKQIGPQLLYGLPVKAPDKMYWKLARLLTCSW